MSPRILLLSALALAASCIESDAVQLAGAHPTAAQAELLDLAFDAASAFPLDPHGKSRARAQQAVVDAALELEQPELALRYAGGIENWRQGLAYAEYALWSARRGASATELEERMQIAAAIADDPLRTAEQDWRRARIRVRLAEAWLTLGDAGRAAELLAGANAAEAGAIERTRARLADADGFDRQLAAVDAVILAGDFDAVRHALEACVELYERFYDDVARRDLAERKVEDSWEGLPVDLNIRLRMGLAEAALRHGDAPRALEVVERAHALYLEQSWTAEDRIRFRAQLAGLRHRCGDVARAREEAEAARTSYQFAREEIVDIYRAGVLIPLAEAFHDLGDLPAALELYDRALEEAFHNPNSRPRCEDFVRLCCSLARRGLAPDAAHRLRLRDARARLSDPW